MSNKAYIGTSGWNYPHWKRRFYHTTPKSQWLSFYAANFSSIEINATFYRLQSEKTMRRWYQLTPDNFRFTIKANRYLTHTKRLRNPEQSIALEQQHAQHLAEKLSVVLWQLPGNFKININRLQQFLDALQEWDKVKHCIEFRHSSWFEDDVADLLSQHNVAVCQSDAGDWPIWQQVTADFVYTRLHGRPSTYVSNYSSAKLSIWASEIQAWLNQGRDVYVYFDNDADGRAPLNAMSLSKLLHSTDS